MADDDAANGMSAGTATLTPPAPADRKEETPQHRRRLDRNGALLLFGIIAAMALAVVCALTWNDVRANARTAADREMFLQAGRQGALNLTTIRWDNVDSDVQRILDGSTGAFHDDFASRAESFNAVVKQAQSTSEGTITEAGLEAVTGDTATVLVAATVKTSNTGAAEQDPRAWRMKVTVQKDGDRALVSNVEFVP
jgi:Mce-associated membrane protein